MAKFLVLIATSILASTAFGKAIEVTDVICVKTGAEPNWPVTAEVGYRFEVGAGDVEITPEEQAEALAFIGSDKVSAVFAQNPAKILLYLAIIDENAGYVGGKGPCPHDDTLVVVGKEVP